MRELMFRLFFVEMLNIVDSEEVNSLHSKIIFKFQKAMRWEYEELIDKVQSLEYIFLKFDYQKIMISLNVLKNVDITHMKFRSHLLYVINKVQKNYSLVGNDIEAQYNIRDLCARLWRLNGFFEANIILKGYAHLTSNLKKINKKEYFEQFNQHLDNFLLELNKKDDEQIGGLNGYFKRTDIIKLINRAKKTRNVYEYARIIKALLEISDAYQSLDIANKNVCTYWPVYELKYNILMNLIR